MRLPVLAAVATVSIFAASSRATVLYDGALGTTPVAQGLSYGSFPLVTYYSTAAGGTTLDTSSSESIAAGFTPTTSATLNRTTGYTLRVDAQLLSSTFTNANRAGFSLIALSSDLKGIEIGFHANSIFAQEGGAAPGLFTAAESVAFNTQTAAHRYEINVLGNTYTLTADGAPILNGNLRDYTQFAGFPDPYETPNFVYLGDDTTSAGGATRFTYVSIAVPEPTMLAAFAGAGLILRRRRV